MSEIKCSKGHQNPLGTKFCIHCGEKMQANSNPSDNFRELLPGHRLRDRYVIRQQLGEGGFGKTYLVEDTGRFNENLVVKEFAPGIQGTGALKKAVELFQRVAIK